MYFPSSLSPNTSLSGHHLPPTMLSLDNDLLMRGGNPDAFRQHHSSSHDQIYRPLHLCLSSHCLLSFGKWSIIAISHWKAPSTSSPLLLLSNRTAVCLLSKKQFLLLIYNFFPSHFFEDFSPSVLFIYASKISFSFLLFLKTSFQAVIPIDFAWLTEISLLSQS